MNTMDASGACQDYTKGGSEFSRSLLSTEIQTKQFATKDDTDHPVYDYSHYIVEIKSLAMCALYPIER